MKNLVENPFAKWEDKADNEIPTATLQIYQWIGENWGRKENHNINRCSSANYCPKRRQYQRQGVEGTPITPRKLVNFMIGDIAEIVMLHLIKEACVGEGKLYSEVDFGELVNTINLNGKMIGLYEQKTLSFTIPVSPTSTDTMTITGHADGFGKRNSDGKWEVIECKSSANWGFKTFKDKGADDYKQQAHAILNTIECKKLGAESTRFFYLRKETGHLWDSSMLHNEEITKEMITNYQISASDYEILPPHELVEDTKSVWRENKELGKKERVRIKTGRIVAVFPCTYCPYLKNCQGDYELDWKEDKDGNSKPIYTFATKERG